MNEEESNDVTDVTEEVIAPSADGDPADTTPFDSEESEQLGMYRIAL